MGTREFVEFKNQRGYKMKTIAIAAVTAGGKTTVVDQLKNRLPKARSLHFDDYHFEGEVEDFSAWLKNGADYNVWNLRPLLADILDLQRGGDCAYLLLDYPFAYCHDMIKNYIDYAIFIDTPLDLALARGILRDMQTATGEEIRNWLETYLHDARAAYKQMQKDILPSSDYVADGDQACEEIVHSIFKQIAAL